MTVCGPAFFAAGSVSLPNSAIRIVPFGDSRADLTFGGSTGPDVHDGNGFNLGGSTDGVPGTAYLPWLLPDADFSANGGQSSDEAQNWDSGTRPPNGRTLAAVLALGGDVMVIQYGTNDIYNGVSDATTRDSISTRVQGDLQGLIADAVAGGLKVVWETILQRTSSGYGSNPTFKRDCCDAINTAMLSWVAGQNPANILASDLRAATNAGGATTGAYANSSLVDSTGTHLNPPGLAVTNPITTGVIRTLFADRGLVPMYRATGANLINTVDATSVPSGSYITNNVTVDSTSYSTVGGLPAVTWLITPNGSPGYFGFQIVADVGTNGGRSAPNTFSTGDKLKGQYFLTLDDGSGGASGCTNVWTNLYATFLVAAEQHLQTGAFGDGPAALPALTNARIITVPQTMPAGSSDIGAPAGGSGLRFFNFVHTAGSSQFRLRIVSPQIRAIT